ncbi:tRNA pseudouridine synthase B [Candidatus Thermoflexus japonica]|uniref:tRNA pseudouridine synthase B n=1 Tax=Candidatus Thermoflexus japonica TaxID=2035417 RepID=A0A2H5YA12_9CHLR|nr:tRNA pseudouridine synthase B [Candidatus Thermoflexus japonica]
MKAPAGLLVLDKPKGWTSHDVVERARKVTRVRRIGHAGTLDPLATGVLVLLVGHATRLAEFLLGHDKRYRATIRLGIRTDTDDAEGRILSERPVEVSRESLEETLRSFVGEILQTPPAFSAIRQGGERLYEKARRGEAVAPPPRWVRIDELRLVEWNPPWATIEVACSAGTYIRALARDIGERLGCGAHLTELRRLASGPFTLADAIPWELLEAAARAGGWLRYLRPMADALPDWEPITPSLEILSRLQHGQPIPVEALPHPGPRLRVHRPDGTLLALLERQGKRWQPVRVFPEDP